jgi:hypothetical protein
MWGKFVYREIIPQQRIVWIHSFSDEVGGVTRHPMAPTWPRESLSSATLAEHEGTDHTMMVNRAAMLLSMIPPFLDAPMPKAE